MKNSSVAIIGGADGPTSVFVAGRTKGIPLKHRIKNKIYRWKSKCAARKITAGERSLEEVIAYAVKIYGAVEIDIGQRKYAVQKNCLKESLISRYKPELLGELAEPIKPEELNADAVKRLQEQYEARRALVEEIPDEKMPMDFHIYEISVGEGRLEMEIDHRWKVFGISYSGSKKSMKKMRKIAKELYLYYGVSKEDIRQKSERYHLLLATLCV